MSHPGLPTKLYKYQPFSVQTLTNLKARTLWFAAPEDFNDPFDCARALADDSFNAGVARRTLQRWIGEGDEEARVQLGAFDTNPLRAKEIMEEFEAGIRQKLLQGSHEYLRNRGVACLSARAEDVLLWSHYADGHRGFCLEFSTAREPFSRALPCEYRSEAARIDVAGVLTRSITSSHIVERVMLTKFEAWAYEQEWRILHNQQRIRYTYDWRDLTGVYFGTAMSDDRKDLIGQVLAGSPTKLYSMHRQAEGFSVLAFPVTYTPYPYPADGPGPKADAP